MLEEEGRLKEEEVKRKRNRCKSVRKGGVGSGAGGGG